MCGCGGSRGSCKVLCGSANRRDGGLHLGKRGDAGILTCPKVLTAVQLEAMSALRHWARSRHVVGRQCVRHEHTLARGERPELRWSQEETDPEVRQARWEEQAGKVRTGMQQSMLSLLEERGFVKDIAG